MCTLPFYIHILYHVLKFSSPQNPLQCIYIYLYYFGLHKKNDQMSPSRRNESTGEEDYVGAGTLLDTDVVATTATKVYNQEDQM